MKLIETFVAEYCQGNVGVFDYKTTIYDFYLGGDDIEILDAMWIPVNRVQRIPTFTAFDPNLDIYENNTDLYS